METPNTHKRVRRTERRKSEYKTTQIINRVIDILKMIGFVSIILVVTILLFKLFVFLNNNPPPERWLEDLRKYGPRKYTPLL